MEGNLTTATIDGRYAAVLNEFVKAGSKGNSDVIHGKALGPKPRYFLVGDEPVVKDYITGAPFSGGLNQILVNAFETLRAKYGAEPKDCYTTYLVKTTFRKGELSERDIEDYWLPALQVEYQASGCDTVVCLGPKARQFSGRIGIRPAVLGPMGGIANRLKRAWEAFRG